MMIFFFGYILYVLGIYEGDCPQFGTYYLSNGICKTSTYGSGCYELDSEYIYDDTYLCKEGSCMYGYYWSDFGGYQTCDVCHDENAMECDNGGVALSCWDGYYFDNVSSICVSCDIFNVGLMGSCDLCNSSTCVRCQDTNTMYEGYCYSCSDDGIIGSDIFARSCDYNGSVITVHECQYNGFVYTTWDDGNHDGLPWCMDCMGSEYIGSDWYAEECVLANEEGSAVTVTECFQGTCLYNSSVTGYYQCYNPGDPNALDCSYYDEVGDYYTITECFPGSSPCQPSGSDDTGCYDCGGGTYYYGIFNTIDNCTFSDPFCSVVDDYNCLMEGTVTADNGVDGCGWCHRFACSDCVYDEEDDTVCNSCVDVPSDYPWWTGFYAVGSTCLRCSSGCSECSDVDTCLKCVSIDCDDCVSGEKEEECYNVTTIKVDSDDDMDDDIDDDSQDDDQDDEDTDDDIDNDNQDDDQDDEDTDDDVDDIDDSSASLYRTWMIF